MKVRQARVLLVLSFAVLFLVGPAWFLGEAGEPRVDLEGESVISASTSRALAAAQDAGGSAADLSALPAAPAPVAEVGVPIRIAIPELGVDSEVVPVGLEDDGSMGLPGASEAGWYQYGQRPGQPQGSAVIAAHVDYNKKPGVFIKLNSLPIGAEVLVTDDAGAVHRFIVTERFQVEKGELPAAELFRTTGDPVLTLVTCGGSFSKSRRSYADNIVIRAVPA
ncbi:MAG: class F sortase [Actinobacteria bacterium]|nr:class F sortase [Actinomycetota bacterium]